MVIHFFIFSFFPGRDFSFFHFFLVVIFRWRFCPGAAAGASLSVVEGLTLRGWGTQRGFRLRDMYLSAGVFVGRGTQEGLTLRNKYLTIGFLVGILKCIISISLILRFYVLQC